MPRTTPAGAAAAAILLYTAWTAATWWFEGRIGTFLRADAAADRAVYAVVVNIGLGVVVALAELSRTAPEGGRSAAGFGPGRPAALWILAALAVGAAALLALGPPSRDPMVLLNAYAQVLVTSAAEIVVCWSLPMAAMLAGQSGLPRQVTAVVVSAGLFGLYHVAHSPPFDTPAMVALLTVIGLVTGTVFVVSRDAWATMLFHTFLGTLGVTRALADTGALGAFETPQPTLLATAALALAVLAAMHRWVLRAH